MESDRVRGGRVYTFLPSHVTRAFGTGQPSVTATGLYRRDVVRLQETSMQANLPASPRALSLFAPPPARPLSPRRSCTAP